MIRRPPSSTRTDTLFSCTTLFRSSGLHLNQPLASVGLERQHVVPQSIPLRRGYVLHTVTENLLAASMKTLNLEFCHEHFTGAAERPVPRFLGKVVAMPCRNARGVARRFLATSIGRAPCGERGCQDV